jgi:hypothetical protein
MSATGSLRISYNGPDDTQEKASFHVLVVAYVFINEVRSIYLWQFCWVAALLCHVQPWHEYNL